MDYLSKTFNLNDKVAVITGGAGTIANALASGFLRCGVNVVLIDINENSLKKSVAELRKLPSNILGLKCNVLDSENLNKVCDQIINEFGNIDILVNAAGGNMPGATIGLNQSIFDLSIDEFDKVSNLNFKGTLLPTLVFGKVMTAKKLGSIINISSMATFRAITRVVGYSAAKAAVDNFTKWMAVELSLKFGSGIRVNAIAPGFLLTDQNRSLLTNEDGSLSERGNDIIRMTPFKRFGEPEELVGSVLWLAGDASIFVTGTIIPIDGGFSIFSGV